jgi:hypothetical protein
VIERLGRDDSDLRIVLEAEPAEARPRLVREELSRTTDANDDERAADMRAWLQAHIASTLEPADIAELWLGGLLELPPEDLEPLVRRCLQAASELDAEAHDTFRQAVTRAMVRFHIPQWMRLQDVFSRAATEVGDPGSWR